MLNIDPATMSEPRSISLDSSMLSGRYKLSDMAAALGTNQQKLQSFVASNDYVLIQKDNYFLEATSNSQPDKYLSTGAVWKVTDAGAETLDMLLRALETTSPEQTS